MDDSKYLSLQRGRRTVVTMGPVRPSNGSAVTMVDLPPLYSTRRGEMIVSKIEDFLGGMAFSRLRGKVNLILTSPPFPLITKKRYGNESGDRYVSWLSQLAPQLADLLAPNGSIVVEVGNAWTKGSPTMSTLPLETLLAFKKAGGYICAST